MGEEYSKFDAGCAIDFFHKITDVEFMAGREYGGSFPADHYRNHVDFRFYGFGFNFGFKDLGKNLYVQLNISSRIRGEEIEKTLEGQLEFDKGSGSGNLSDKLVGRILREFVIEGIRNFDKI